MTARPVATARGNARNLSLCDRNHIDFSCDLGVQEIESRLGF